MSESSVSERGRRLRQVTGVLIAVVVCWLLVVAGTRAQLPDVGEVTLPATPDNAGPTVDAIHLRVDGMETDRDEIEHDIVVTTDYTESKTAVSHLIFNWEPPVGEIRGEGPSVIWHIPKGTPTPVSPVLNLELVEQCPVFSAGLIPSMREHRTRVTAPVIHVNDSIAELTKLAHAFLVDYFGNSSVSPEACLVDFSDTCKGKEDELGDIRINRAKYQIHRAWTKVSKIEFHPSMNAAYITAPCEIYDLERETNREHMMHADCLLTAVYDKPRWWLCDSHTANGTQRYVDDPASERPLPTDPIKPIKKKR